MQKKRESIILEILGKKNNLTFREILLDSRIINDGKQMGTESLVLGLDELVRKNLIEKDKKRYSIISNTDNKTLLGVRKHNLMNYDLDEKMKELADNEEPFVIGYALIRGAMFDLSKFTLERSSSGLKENEKVEFDNIIKRCNDTIEKTFSVLHDLDELQYEAIKTAIDNAITIPEYEKGLAKLSTNRQQRRAKKIAVKINNTIS